MGELCAAGTLGPAEHAEPLVALVASLCSWRVVSLSR